MNTKTITVGSIALHAPNKLRRFPVAIEIKLTDKRLSISGSYGDPAGRYGGGGQCRDIFDDPTFHAYWPAERIARLREVWERWHLNDMRAGCEHQRAEGWSDRPIDPSKPTDGLLGKPCETCGYRYGTAWLSEEIPADVLADVRAWIGDV